MYRAINLHCFQVAVT